MSRYLDNPRVNIQLGSIPPALRVLSPYFSKWDVYGGASRTEERNRSLPDELAAFVAACRPLEAGLYDYAIASCPEEGPVPDEVVLMQLLYHAYREAEGRPARLLKIDSNSGEGNSESCFLARRASLCLDSNSGGGNSMISRVSSIA